MRVVVCGCGVVGASIAFFLARRGVDVTVIERAGVACAASGKSGGFLALDWCDGTPLAALARRSFALHADLAEEIPGHASYRRMTTYGGLGGEDIHGNSDTCALEWTSPHIKVSSRLGSTQTTAQVHPGAFTHALMQVAQTYGAKLRLAQATGLVRGGCGSRIRGVAIGSEVVEGDAIVIAMGPWSILASQWLPLPAVFGLKGHSLVFETGTKISPEALFLEYREADGTLLSPEFFPRPDGTTYVCAISSETPLPVNPADVAPEPGAIERLRALSGHVSPVLRESRILASQACFRPVTRDGLPLIGRIPGVPGAYVATGHSVWGILNAPATAEAMAELIVDGASRTVDLSPFDPGRMRPLDRAQMFKAGQ
ncbi:MAG: FAD-binding oxidoreductase [Methylobacteriaceae bacterium]|nr:FAD-binding oxidoreductase [Methylobacteriaceae bacterium]